MDALTIEVLVVLPKESKCFNVIGIIYANENAIETTSFRLYNEILDNMISSCTDIERENR